MDTLLKFEIDEILGTRAACKDPENPSGDEAVAEPVGKFVENLPFEELNKTAGIDFDWSAPVSVGTDAPLATNHPKDGETIERNGKQLWKYTYKGGICTHMLLQDPDLEDGRMEFDGQGNEIAA